MKTTITIGEKYSPAMKITDPVKAGLYFEECVQHLLRLDRKECAERVANGGSAKEPMTRERAEEIEKSNIAYFAGYGDNEMRERVERLFKCAHPIFGEIAKNGAPTALQAFTAGVRAGEHSK